MKAICIVSHGPIDCNSGRHIAAIAERLVKHEVDVTVAVPILKPNNNGVKHSFNIVSLDDLRQVRNLASSFSLMYYWSPRKMMVSTHNKISSFTEKQIPYIVHLEDNDLEICMNALNISNEKLAQASVDPKISLNIPDFYCDPFAADLFLSNSKGVTALSTSLLKAIPDWLPRLHFWPAFEPSSISVYSEESISQLRKELNISDEDFIVSYTGNVHLSNVAEVRSLYIAVALVNRMGMPLKLVRSGCDHARLFTDDEWHWINKHVICLGTIDLCQVFNIQKMSTMLVQPGLADTWNECRVPSKIPEYLASGRPVIVPKANIGHCLSHEDNAICLEKANAEQIALALLKWLPKRTKLNQIGSRGACFAAEVLNWDITVQRLLCFIDSI
jgi:glycosyltransferase involved in cell wall biosynthesis